MAAFGLLATVQVTLILAITVIAIALPAIQEEMGLTASELAVVSAAYGLSFSGLLLLGGRLADLYGRRRVFVVGLVVFGLASAAVGPTSTLAELFAARFGQGVGAALAAPSAMALLAAVFPDPARRERALALWGGLAPVGATLGLMVSGIAVTWTSWRWAFAVPTAVAIAALLAAPRLLPAESERTSGGLDVPGALLVTTGTSALTFGLAMVGEAGWSSPPVALSLGVGGLVLCGFVVVESRSGAPLVPLSFFRSSRRVLALLAVLLAGAGTATVSFFLSLHLQQAGGMSAIETSAAFLPYGAALLAGVLVAGRLVERLGARIVAAGGLLVAAAGLFLIGRMSADAPYAGLVALGLIVFPVGAALTFAGATVTAVDDVDASRAGLAGGVVNTALELGPTVGLAVLVSLAGARATRLRDTGYGPEAAMTSGYAFALTASAIAFAVAAAIIAFGPRARTTRSRSETDPSNRLVRGETP